MSKQVSIQDDVVAIFIAPTTKKPKEGQEVLFLVGYGKEKQDTWYGKYSDGEWYGMTWDDAGWQSMCGCEILGWIPLPKLVLHLA